MALSIAEKIWRIAWRSILGGILVGLLLGSAEAVEPAFRVGRLTFEYRNPQDGRALDPALPRVEEFGKLSVLLVDQGGVWKPGAVGDGVAVRLDGDGVVRKMTSGALVAMTREVVADLNRRGVYGVLAVVDSDDIDLETDPPTDDRGGRTDLKVLVYYSRVAEVGIERGRSETADWMRSPERVGERIQRGAPLREGDLFRKDDLQAYLDRVNRFDGRRAETLVAAGAKPGTVKLTIGLTEQKRFAAHVMSSNTGTQASGRWRSRLGAEGRQLLGLDDVLSMDYSTSDFERYQTFSLSEDVGVIFPEVLRAKIFGSFSKLSLSDLGQTGTNFNSTSKSVGLQTTWVPGQWNRWPLLVTVGTYLMDVQVENGALGTTGGAQFWVPSVGIGTERQTVRGRTVASVQMERSSASGGDLTLLGRTRIDADAWVSRWNVLTSRRGASFSDLWKERSERVGSSHELTVSMRGQVAMDGARVAPYFQGIAGGMDTVRGYRESLLAGDTVSLASLEYRLRVSGFRGLVGGSGAVEGEDGSEIQAPRGGSSEADRAAARGESRPSRRLGTAGLPVEVALRGFVDAAQVQVHEALASDGERSDRTLAGAGFGIDVLMRGKVNGLVRADLGFALKGQSGVGGGDIRAGDARLHLSVMLLW